jgi:L-asparaginase II
MHGDGSMVASLGDPEHVTFFRSSAKPFQALPLVISGAADYYGLTPEELALACGSHGGERKHVETVLAVLHKIGLSSEALECGAHAPYDPDAKKQLHDRHEAPTALHNNCSGKHAGMLALARFLGEDIPSYLQPGHPVQQKVLAIIGDFSGLPPESIPSGIDGCGVPTYALPLRVMAQMYARLIVPPAAFDVALQDACRRIVTAMTAYPEMVEGTAEGESLDSALMAATDGRLVSKVGAEGVYTAAVLPCEAWPAGLAVAMKIEDGDGAGRARSPIVIELLRQLGILGARELDLLKAYTVPEVKNHRGKTVGRVQTSFMLGDPSA